MDIPGYYDQRVDSAFAVDAVIPRSMCKNVLSGNINSECLSKAVEIVYQRSSPADVLSLTLSVSTFYIIQERCLDSILGLLVKSFDETRESGSLKIVMC